MPVEVKINKNQIELYAVGKDTRDIIKNHRNFYVGLRIKSGKNNIKELLTSGSCEEGRYIIKSVMVEGNFFTSFEEVKKQFNINGQPKSIESTFECHAKDLADLFEAYKKKAQDNAAQLEEEKNAKITELEALDAVALQQKLTEKENEITALKAQPDAAVTKLEGEKTTLTNKIKDLEAQLSNRPDAAQLQVKDEKIKDLEAKINQPNAEVESLKKDLQAQNSQVQQLTQKNKELEAKNKTTEQPEQDNKAKYTATVGMGLVAGLVAFTALERTVRLEMLVMVGIAVASALVAGGITYAVLPGTQVDGAKAQEVNENGKKK